MLNMTRAAQTLYLYIWKNELTIIFTLPNACTVCVMDGPQAGVYLTNFNYATAKQIVPIKLVESESVFSFCSLNCLRSPWIVSKK